MNIEQFVNNCDVFEYKEKVTFTYKEVQVLFDFLSKMINSNGPGFSVYHHTLFIDNYNMLFQAMNYVDSEIRKHFNDNTINKVNEYNAKKELLIQKFIDRDEQGDPIYKDGKAVITDNLVEFNNEVQKLDIEYKPVLEQIGNKQQEFQKFLIENTVSLEKLLMFKDFEMYNELFTPTIFSIYLNKA